MEQMYDDVTLKKLQNVELEILKVFIDLCDKNDIPYFIMYGSLLGAVRHQGFIPWDDDIDVVIERKEYERFLSIAKEQLPEGYELLNVRNNHNYPLFTTRMIKKGTEFRDKSLKNCKCNFGIFLDVFAFDNMISDVEKRNRIIKKIWLYGKLYVVRQLPFPTLPFHQPLMRGIAKCIFCLSHYILKLTPKMMFYKKTETLMRQFEHTDCDYFGYFCDSDAFSSLFRKEDVYPLKKMRFEDIEVNVPNKCHEILTQIYGDYMKLPDEDKRCLHQAYRLNLGNGEIHE